MAPDSRRDLLEVFAVSFAHRSPSPAAPSAPALRNREKLHVHRCPFAAAKSPMRPPAGPAATRDRPLGRVAAQRAAMLDMTTPALVWLQRAEVAGDRDNVVFRQIGYDRLHRLCGVPAPRSMLQIEQLACQVERLQASEPVR